VTSLESIPLGVALPHRAAAVIPPEIIGQVATMAEQRGFADLWVTENTLDHACSYDPTAILSFAAALTTRIRLGVAVVALPVRHPAHVAHQIASLDRLSGGRAILGVGLGRQGHYRDFQVLGERRVRRLLEGIEVMRALWTQTSVSYHGELYQLDDAVLALKPVQRPHPPLWFGGEHPAALRRAAQLGDGWMGSGSQSLASFAVCVKTLTGELDRAGRDRAAFTVSKRVFLAVHDRPEAARAELEDWFDGIYGGRFRAADSGIGGTAAQVAEQLAELATLGLNHLVLNPVARYAEHLELLADLAGLPGGGQVLPTAAPGSPAGHGLATQPEEP
jgi:probable F420-dependent oxidoreductase